MSGCLAQGHNMVPPEKLKPTTPLSQVEHSTTGWLYRYHTAIWSLYRHVVCDVPVSCKANGDRKQLWAWPFLSHLHEILLSIKDLEKFSEFNLLQNLHLCTQNLFVPQTSDLLEKLALIFLHNFHCKRSLLKF